MDPNRHAYGYEGLRGILINRKSPIEKQGIPLNGLYLSGIGYRLPRVVTNKGLIYFDKDSPICPPTNSNFMELMPENLMGTTYEKKSTNFRIRRFIHKNTFKNVHQKIDSKN